MDEATRRSAPPEQPYYPPQPIPDEPTRRSQRVVPGRRKTRRRKGRKHTLRAIAVGLVIGLLMIGLGVVIAFFSFYGYYQAYALILPGVYVGDIDLSGKSLPEAAALLNQTWNVDRGLIVTDGTRTWYAPPADFGLTLDPVATAQRALDIGHGGGLISETFVFVDVFLSGQVVAPVATVNAEAARAGLSRWSDTINIPAQDATIAIENGQVVALAGKPGYILNVEKTLAAMTADPGLVLLDGYLPLALDAVAPQVVDVSGAIEQAERMLASDLTIDAYDAIQDEHSQWAVSRETLASWLAINASDTGPEVTVSEAALKTYLDGLSGQLGADRGFDMAASAAAIQTALESGIPSVSLIVTHAPTNYTVEPGDTLIRIAWKVGMPYWRILEANPGLNADTLDVGQVIVIPSKDVLLPLPIIVGKRIVVDLSEQRLRAYENGVLKWDWVISTGIDRSPTQPGVFQVQTREKLAYASVWDLHMPDFLGIYESWPGFMNGFHGLPSRNGGQVLWAESLGRPTSFGCIILNLDNSATLYEWAEDGVVVEIVE